MADRHASFADLIARLPAGSAVAGALPARDVTSVTSDSRAVKPGAVFVALRGRQADGHRYVTAAAAAGAAGVVVDRAPREPLPAHVTVVTVRDTQRALSSLAAAFYRDPSHAVDVVGITGTNGKTTTLHMLQAILDAAGISNGAIGTVGAAFGDQRWQLAHTTPLPPELQALLAEMRDGGARVVTMEVSSHALALDRVADVRFRIGVLTNVSRDHLDFHESLEAYASAKRRLFALARHAVINVDDIWGARWAAELAADGAAVTTYSARADAGLSATLVEAQRDAIAFSLDGTRIRVPVPGRFNVANALAAVGAARALGIGDTTSARGLAHLARVPGRMQRLCEDGIDAIVDYAHTPDALHNALSALRESARGSLSVVFGCGGDRDRGKRGEMGAAAAALADRVYVTSDNPRSEDPQAIADQIIAGIGDRAHVVELDRRRAIERAICEARAGDVVLVAGKGHETYQIVGDEVREFDDAAVVGQALRMRGALR